MTKQAEYRRWLHSKGLCCDCKQRDAFTMNGRWRCAECGEKYNQWQSERRKAGAQAKENASARAQYAERKETGLCVQCGKPAVSGKVRCPRCLKRDCKAKKKVSGGNIPKRTSREATTAFAGSATRNLLLTVNGYANHAATCAPRKR